MSRKALLLFALVCAFPLFAADPSLVQADWFCEGAGCGFTADVNGDGLDDLFDMQRRELRYNLDGAFTAPVSITGIADNETLVSAEDYNGDGFVDLVLWPNRGPHDEGPNRMAYGDGTGRFTAGSFPTEYGGLGQKPPRDFNGDGKPDLVLGKFFLRPDYDNVWMTLSFLRGNGDGTFVLDQQLTFRNSAYPFTAIADFNGDGHYDLVRNGDDSHRLYVHYSDKNGRLRPARERFVGIPVSRVQAGDVNGDGRPDVVLETSGPSGKAMFLLFNDGRGKFTAVAEMPSMGTAWSPVVGDIYPGGGDEIALTHSNGHLFVYSAVGNELRAVASTQIGGTYYHAALMRFRSGGARDFVVTDRVFTTVPNTNRSKIVFVEGELPYVAASKSSVARRTRAIQRGSSISAYAATVTGECAPASLNNWAFTREGMFVDFEPRADGTELHGSIMGGKLVTRVNIGERLMTGSLNFTGMEIRGYLYDQTTNSCGGTGRVLVDAIRVQQ